MVNNFAKLEICAEYSADNHHSSGLFDHSIDIDTEGYIKPDKTKPTEKIDGVVALIMGLEKATRNEESSLNNYDERGILIL